MTNNKNQYNYLGLILPTVVFIAIIIVYMTPSDSFISLPAYIARYEGLYDPNVVDTVRYYYRGATLGVVYGIVNNINGKVYVGSTFHAVKRFYEHLVSGFNSNKHLQHAINLYGIQWFSLVIFKVGEYPLIGGGLDRKALFADEQIYMDKFPSEQKYNMAQTAGGGSGPKTQEQKDLMSERMTGVNIGRSPINKGVPVTPVMKEIRRAASLHRSHIIYIYDDMFNLVAMYPSINEAVLSERTQKNKFIAHVKNGTLWRGYTVTRLERNKL